MARVVFFGFPAYGHTNPTLPVVKELIARGEEVYYYSSEEFRGKIESAGAIFREYKIQRREVLIPLSGVTLEELRSATVLDFNKIIETFVNNLGIYSEVMIHSPVDLTQEVRELNPDYIIHDSHAGWGKVIARRLGIPGIASVTIFAYCDRVMEEQPEFVIRNVLSLSDEFLKNIPATRKMLRRVSTIIEHLYNIDHYDCIDHNFSQEDLNIVYTSREFQLFSGLFDSRFQFVGPSIMPRADSEPFPLEKLAGKKVIYISLGSIFSHFFDYAGLFRRCIEAFCDTDYEVVLAAGKIDPAGLGEIPANFTVRSFVPQLEILERASLFITHAGMNSTNEALYHYVPLIVIPQGWDQFLVARRVEELGVGIYLRDLDFSVAGLREAVYQIMNDDTYRRNCQKIGDSLRAAGGYKRAADEIFAYKERNYQT
ncbi:MAG: glycosyl transferase family 1 [Firmicutes bacterium]|nr:glycosyl transferase family 1 [Bacillota bacterium]